MKPFFQVEIKKPCLVNLDSVIPDEKGQFCSVCQSSVVDFTNKSPDEITQYFQENKHKRTCGTFNSWDVKTENKTDQLISYLQNKKLKMVAVFIIGLLVLSGCRVRTRGKIAMAPQDPRTLNDQTHPKQNSK